MTVMEDKLTVPEQPNYTPETLFNVGGVVSIDTKSIILLSVAVLAIALSFSLIFRSVVKSK